MRPNGITWEMPGGIIWDITSGYKMMFMDAPNKTERFVVYISKEPSRVLDHKRRTVGWELKDFKVYLDTEPHRKAQ